MFKFCIESCKVIINSRKRFYLYTTTKCAYATTIQLWWALIICTLNGSAQPESEINYTIKKIGNINMFIFFTYLPYQTQDQHHSLSIYSNPQMNSERVSDLKRQLLSDLDLLNRVNLVNFYYSWPTSQALILGTNFSNDLQIKNHFYSIFEWYKIQSC